MSRLTEADVARIARLARVRVEDNTLPALTKELSEVVGFVDQLQSVETEGVAETSQVPGFGLSSAPQLPWRPPRSFMFLFPVGGIVCGG
jgi:aspartyl-tRNA(Asn)/glutamyl-tRNA(Gln) amidotransferase subunit C